MNFKTDKTVDKKADSFAREIAEEWCKDNAEWEYTGVWKNERSQENQAVERSHFEVRKKVAPADSKAPAGVDAKPVVMETTDEKLDDSKKRPVVDQKQSFVDQVSEGLEKKIPKERFENTAPETPVKEDKDQTAAEENKSEEEAPPAQAEDATNVADDLGAPVKEEASKDGGENADEADAAKEPAVENQEEEAKEEEAKADQEEEAKADQEEAKDAEDKDEEEEEEKAVEPTTEAKEEAKTDAEAPSTEVLEVEKVEEAAAADDTE